MISRWSFEISLGPIVLSRLSFGILAYSVILRWFLPPFINPFLNAYFFLTESTIFWAWWRHILSYLFNVRYISTQIASSTHIDSAFSLLLDTLELCVSKLSDYTFVWLKHNLWFGSKAGRILILDITCDYWKTNTRLRNMPSMLQATVYLDTGRRANHLDFIRAIVTIEETLLHFILFLIIFSEGNIVFLSRNTLD